MSEETFFLSPVLSCFSLPEYRLLVTLTSGKMTDMTRITFSKIKISILFVSPAQVIRGKVLEM